MFVRTVGPAYCALFLLVVSGAYAGAGCSTEHSEFYVPLTDTSLVTGGSGGTGGAPPECIPQQTSEAIADDCGVFVSAATGDDADSGSKDAPLRTLGKAIEVAAKKNKPVYACVDAAAPFTEALEIDGSVQLFGALDCMTWKYSAGAKTRWNAPADTLPLRLADGASIAIEDMRIEAADAVAPGGSSIAVLAQAGAEVSLARCDVVAGNGAAGEPGDTPAGSGMAGVDGMNGTGDCDSAMGEFGAPGGMLTCAAAVVDGGLGGQGVTINVGGAGSPGQPIDAMTGLGGIGQAGATSCINGGDGAEGAAGEPGAGASGMGALSASGYLGVTGSDGASPGVPGQGGGGGGGASKCSNNNAGPSAGGGGSGGCGGAPGKGGQAGGASIAIVSLGATLTFTNVNVISKNGGRGGDGGDGQPGGDGGNGGQPGAGDATATACSGGKGGKGGAGGKGGGGLGGPSVGIAHTGDAPDVKGVLITLGAPGDGGTGDGATGNGEQGVAEQVQSY